MIDEIYFLNSQLEIQYIIYINDTQVNTLESRHNVSYQANPAIVVKGWMRLFLPISVVSCICNSLKNISVNSCQ